MATEPDDFTTLLHASGHHLAGDDATPSNCRRALVTELGVAAGTLKRWWYSIQPPTGSTREMVERALQAILTSPRLRLTAKGGEGDGDGSAVSTNARNGADR
jgi:hypothetical protein